MRVSLIGVAFEASTALGFPLVAALELVRTEDMDAATSIESVGKALIRAAFLLNRDDRGGRMMLDSCPIVLTTSEAFPGLFAFNPHAFEMGTTWVLPMNTLLRVSHTDRRDVTSVKSVEWALGGMVSRAALLDIDRHSGGRFNEVACSVFTYSLALNTSQVLATLITNESRVAYVLFVTTERMNATVVARIVEWTTLGGMVSRAAFLDGNRHSGCGGG
ncbi:MAG: hypothetical protein Q9184_002201 [Pyrenodesmia sp. 2 TL-2023]